MIIIKRNPIMKQIDHILTAIARDQLGIPTLETRRSDSLDFHDVSVWCVRSALETAFNAGAAAGRVSGPGRSPVPAATGQFARAKPSPAPWQYEYSPYTLREAGDGEADAV